MVRHVSTAAFERLEARAVGVSSGFPLIVEVLDPRIDRVTVPGNAETRAAGFTYHRLRWAAAPDLRLLRCHQSGLSVESGQNFAVD